MRISHILAALVLFPLAAAAATTAGTWALDSADEPGKVQFSLQGSSGGDHFNTSSPWLLADLRGLDWAGTAKHDVHFTIQRDAGSIDCEGFVKDQRGSGLFTFKANPQYVAEMAKLGFSFEDKNLLSATIFDVSFDFARAMKNAAVRGLDAGKLFAFRIHGVTPEFIRDLRAAGLEAADAGKLIAFRIHGVTPEFVRDLQGAGVSTTDEDKLIAFRIHGVSPEFAGEISHLGYPHAPPEQLIALRIHGVTPQYVEGLRSKGMQNLTLDQLISLRIHGID
jgi:4-hydroxy-3-methylbut-2-enyl diphosphate reductase IspH